ncbi:TPA: 1-deoxy-D-xylulose-5-phosphate reductoisomerase [Candidatus Poribacteria bacterium]|jgi:1-deoxy-D-xylulose-5-phosphate reductoisomerase|nr:1-deoxy-D-xylulose-5-phosphate reductoisomerase [Candidatus Poribacteria bacterium]HIB90268.1 1-deoxy-D-xylulose-5-phosphate reductoisomerase [Candidatus Poribacteria bacterium]HIC03320.1 1-deoxy-D-xylulose-5-phosphate reductoisomerase [Candidatus Poribacteria bacterium]HIM10350.1 1-deoxy-D-xylulose-5-phosphate reductoisomerase [Candidatus Poribacteria bacterium]HIN29107.1 1-deoxy-D-xylulose-5-phosphate reductoisomerase [Candidatus Poribacteria bacterium]
MKNIAILGSTGSIGKSALSIAKIHPDLFTISALAANTSVDLIEQQVRQFNPKLVALYDQGAASLLRQRISDLKSVDVMSGAMGISAVATIDEAELVLEAMGGSIGLLPTLEAIQSGKDLAFVNKEVLVMCGSLVQKAVKKHNVKLLPVDSEISAIFQCLPHPFQKNRIHKLILTASGGPFWKTSSDKLKDMTPEQALKHPNWTMGNKVTIDSATMMNKGLEVIEAKCFFELELKKIEVVVHAESIIHSMVEFVDGSLLAQLGVPDMRVPIQYALTYPDRLENPADRLDFSQIRQFHFEPPDFKRFPCLDLAYTAAEVGGTLPTVLSGSDEVAVDAFLNRQIGFMDIPAVLRRAMDLHDVVYEAELDQILEINRWTREITRKIIGN